MSPKNLWPRLNERVWEYWTLLVSCFEQINDSYHVQYQKMAIYASFECNIVIVLIKFEIMKTS